MRRLEGGERERHLRAMEDATSSPGRTRAASSATRSRPGPTTVKGIKAKMPRWRAARRGGAPMCTSSSGVIRTLARSNPGIAPCRRADPLVHSGDGRKECGRSPGPEPKQGPIFFCALVGWAKALARHFPDGKDSRAPCPRCHDSQLYKNAWARRTMDFVAWESRATAFAHPTIRSEPSLTVLSHNLASSRLVLHLPFTNTSVPLAAVQVTPFIG